MDLRINPYNRDYFAVAFPYNLSVLSAVRRAPGAADSHGTRTVAVEY